MTRKKALILGLDTTYSGFIAQTGLFDIETNLYALLNTPEKFELIIFTGGEDITPSFYEETSPLGMCHYNIGRDKFEKRIFDFAKKRSIKMFGICRGAQFLNVMTGGKMIHHLEGHAGCVHEVELVSTNITNRTFSVVSTHHQMCLPHANTHVLAYSVDKRSNVYYGDKDEKMIYNGREVEAIYNAESAVLGFQWHPEMMRAFSQGRLASLNILKDFVCFNRHAFEEKYITQKADKYFWR